MPILDNEYKHLKDFESRRQEAHKMLEKYPGQIPVVCIFDKQLIRNPDAKSYCKFIIARDLTLGSLMHNVRKKIKISQNQSIFVFSEMNSLLSSSFNLGVIYTEHISEDKFLYLYIKVENAFGIQ